MSVVERAPRRGTLWSGPTAVHARPLAHDPETAFLIISGAHDDNFSFPGTDIIEQWLATLASWGYSRVRTSALSVRPDAALRAVGFTPVQDLMLMSMTHWTPPEFSLAPDIAPKKALRWGKRISSSQRDNILRLDARAFGTTWALDTDAFTDALHATSRTQVFVAQHKGILQGFAIVGVTGGTGYLQRLAVDADAQRVGVGSCLVATAVQWASRRGCRHTVVNTEVNNQTAQRLYEKIGFVALPNRLTVLQKELQ
jgi:ribosomal protein S18 acetylase RimI-like enzyme